MLMIDIPPSVVIGRDIHLYHRWFGVVINRDVTIGDRVHIFHHVTIGKKEVTGPRSADYGGVTVESDAWLCVGAIILGGSDRLVVGEGTIVGANSVLTESTGKWEVWAGCPARQIGTRSIDRSIDPLARIKT
jgi:serine O-acetyltransferase